MKKSKFSYLVAGLALCVTFTLAQGAHAAVVFSDDFNATNQQLNQTVFAKWTVTAGSVDVIGDGGSYAFLPPGNGNYVDLNGSTGAPGTLTTNMIFAPGSYQVSFDLAGSQGGSGNVDHTSKTTQISFAIGGVAQSLTLNPSSPLTHYTFNFTTTSAGALSFTDLAGGNNNVGNLLDNVSVSAVPEASTWAMMILGFLGLGFLGYRKSSSRASGMAFRMA